MGILLRTIKSLLTNQFTNKLYIYIQVYSNAINKYVFICVNVFSTLHCLSRNITSCMFVVQGNVNKAKMSTSVDTTTSMSLVTTSVSSIVQRLLSYFVTYNTAFIVMHDAINK